MTEPPQKMHNNTQRIHPTPHPYETGNTTPKQPMFGSLVALVAGVVGVTSHNFGIPNIIVH